MHGTGIYMASARALYELYDRTSDDIVWDVWPVQSMKEILITLCVRQVNMITTVALYYV